MVPGTPFTKIWRFRNTGTTQWPQGTKIVNVGGDKLSEQESFALQVRRGQADEGGKVFWLSLFQVVKSNLGKALQCAKPLSMSKERGVLAVTHNWKTLLASGLRSLLYPNPA